MKHLISPAFIMLALGFVGCQTEKLEEPLTYSFNDVFVNYSLPSVQISNPAPTKSTLAEVNTSKANLEALEALKNSQPLTSEMEKSLQLIQSNVSSSTITELENSFNATELAAISKGQPMSSQIQKNVNTILNSGAVDLFRSEVILPTLDGKLLNKVVLEKSAYEHVFGESKIEPAKEPKKPCKNEANNAFTINKIKVDLEKVTSEKAIVNNYSVAASAYDSQLDADKVATAKTFNTSIAKAVENYNLAKAKINTNKQLTEAQKAAANVLEIALLNDEVTKLSAAQVEQVKADLLKKELLVSKAVIAKNNDLLKVKVKYEAELDKLNALLGEAKGRCHNQGGN